VVSQRVHRQVQGIPPSPELDLISTKPLFQEASQNTIEVLDDDPQNFELMLKFIYTMDLVPLQTDRPTPALKLKLDILDPIGVYILADKYEVIPLLVRTCSQVKDAMATHSGILNGNVINQIITAYYDRCPRVQSSMGITIAQGLDIHAGSWISGAKGSAKHSFEQTVKDYGCFATDLLLALRSSKRFDFSN